MNMYTTETSSCTCAWHLGFEPWRSRWAQCIQQGWVAAQDAVDAGIAQYIPDWHRAVGRDCRNCGTRETVDRRYRYAGHWWVNLGCGHTQLDDEH